jgi:hypothetical protein
MKWHDLWPFARTWWGWTVGITSVLVALYQGPRLMFDTWGRYCEIFRDNKVRYVLEQRKIIPASGVMLNGRHAIPEKELPYSVKEIADSLKRTESSVQRSLRRLRRNGKVTPYQDGWRLT